jgi:hypothetical protein
MKDLGYMNSKEEVKIQEEYLGFEPLQFENFESFEGQENVAAEGQKGVKADPIIITVTNTNTVTTLTSVECLYASRRSGTLTGISPAIDYNQQTSGISPSFNAGVANITYQQMLNTIFAAPFQVGMTRLIGQAAQIQVPFTVATYNITGAFAGKPVIVNYDTYQLLTTQIDNFSPYYLNLNTSFVLPNLYASSASAINVLTIYWYPEFMVKQGKGVAKFHRPDVNYSQKRIG